MFNPLGGGLTAFKFPEGRKLWIEGCATREELANAAEVDSEGERCLIVGKDGSSTDLTVGRYAGLASSLLSSAFTARASRLPKSLRKLAHDER